MRRRLVVSIVAVAAASVALFALPLAVVVRRTYRDEELLKLQRDTVAATRTIDLAIHSDPIELPRDADQLAVYNRAGALVAGAGPLRASALALTAMRTGRPADEERGGELITAVPLLVREHVSGAVLGERSAAAVAERTHRVWWQLAGLAGAVLLVAAAAAMAAASRLASPLERLALAARRLGDGEFATRAPRSGIPQLDGVASALDATAQRLDELVSRERAFSADASHQLRTPLAALRIELEAMVLRGDGSPEVAAALHQVDRLQTTIDTLLAVARDEPRASTPSNLAALLDDLAATWRGELARLARPLRISVPSSPAIAHASPTVVREILDVLLSNACRHGAGLVSVTVRESGNWLAVDVCDEGDGLDDPQRAFDRRSTTADGHGIGLALARSLAHAEGGRLTLRASGPLPTFTLIVPRPDAPPRT